MSAIPLAEALQRVVVALLIGFLIGLDRERAEVRKQRREFAGIRTFPLIALIGAISVLLADSGGPLLVVGSLLAVSAVAVVSYLRSSAEGATGATTEIASVATFLLGALAGGGQLLLAGALGIAVAVLLVAKPPLEGFSRALSEAEVAAALQLAVITGIILPLLPNRGYGPWGVWNPFDIWLVVVLVAGVSFAGFVAVRTLGENRGMALAGLLGGLVSSTAVTAAMAQRARDDEGVGRPAAAAAALASVVMCARVALFAAAFGAGILVRLGWVLVAMAAAGGLAAWLLGRRAGAPRGGATAQVANPTSLGAALTFAVLYAVILVVVRGAQELLGAAGMYVAAALSSVADVDAVTIAFAGGGPGDDAWRHAAAAVSLALVVNTLFKLGLAAVLGSGTFRLSVAGALGFMAAAGAAAAVAVFLYP